MTRLLSLALLLLCGCVAGSPGAQAPRPPAFVLMGDAPYSQPHANLLDAMIEQINQAQPAFVVHLGDITGGLGPCTDAWFEARKRQFARFGAPFVLVVGDNEWTDCHRSGFDPLERLAKIRTLFHAQTPALTGFARQSSAYPEHTRWTWERFVFVGLNVPGSNNNLGRTQQMDAEYAARMKAVLDWLDQGVKTASDPHYRALVVMMQADPDFEGERRLFGRPDGYAGLRAALVAAARTLDKPLLLAHGDTHHFRDDHPVADATNLRRVEVDGWPALGWVLMQARPSAGDSLTATREL